MGFTWVFLPPKSSSLQRKISHLQLSIPLWLTSIWPMRFLWVGWLVLSVLIPTRIFMLATLGLFPRGQPGTRHLIVDLSSPGRASVNNGIDPNKFTLHYITINHVIRLVSKLGMGTLMAKFDGGSLPQHTCTPVQSHSSGDEVALPILRGPGSPFWPSISSFYFQLHCRHGGLDPCQFIPDSRPPPLLGQLHHCRSPSVPPVCTELGYCYGGLPTARSTFAYWQVSGPLYGTCCPGYRARLHQQSGKSSQEKL